MDVDEMVAIFLLTIGHNAKNRTCQTIFHRSGEIVFRTIRAVLEAVLNLHNILLEKPTPVPENCSDHRWKLFKVNANLNHDCNVCTFFLIYLSHTTHCRVA
ncbi:hypothetical protein LINPERHAP1_LOCUS8884 [Linum perenne]